MSVKNTVLVGVTVIGLAVGVNQMLDPAKVDQHRREQQIQDLADADARSKDAMRDKGRSHADAENARRDVPGEHRPPDPKPRTKIRLRLP